jgi:hypothetical protein
MRVSIGVSDDGATVLSKRVCVACYKSAYPDAAWRKFEKTWKQSELSCPPCHGKTITYVEDPPPEWCPYKLEHLMEQRQRKKR